MNSYADELTGRTALITSGTSGIGKAIAKAFLRAGDPALFIQGGVTSRPGVDHIVDSAIDRLGHLDILVNNAGGLSSFGPVTEISAARP